MRRRISQQTHDGDQIIHVGNVSNHDFVIGSIQEDGGEELECHSSCHVVGGVGKAFLVDARVDYGCVLTVKEFGGNGFHEFIGMMGMLRLVGVLLLLLLLLLLWITSSSSTTGEHDTHRLQCIATHVKIGIVYKIIQEWIYKLLSIFISG